MGGLSLQSKDNFSPLQLDLLKELGNIGAGNATSALSTMLGDTRLNMVVPEAVVCSLPETLELVGGPESVVVGIYISMSGDADGHVVFLIPKEKAITLVSMLLGNEVNELDEMGISALQEVGNIVVTSYLNALSEMTGLTLMPSVPALAVDMAGAVWGAILAGARITEDFLVVIKAEFLTSDESLDALIIMIPGADYLHKIFSILLGPENV